MNKAAGFITLHRQILDWEWYKNTNTFVLFVHLLLSSNFVEGRFEGKIVKRGQLVTSLPSLSAETGLSVQQVRTALKNLVSTGEITDDSTNRYRIITITKYSEFQNVTDKSTDNQQTDNRQLTGQQQATNRQSTGNQQQYNNITIEQGNKVTKEQSTTSASRRKKTYEDSFSVFWESYPKKQAKADALKAWKKLKPDDDPLLYGNILDGLEAWKKSEQWNRDGGQYIPLPSSWLNKRRWEDDILMTEKYQKPAPAPAPVRKIAAQQYDQRDYGDEDEAAYQRMVAEWRNG